MARWSSDTVGRELNTGHLEDASDRTTGNSIKSAVCNTDITLQVICLYEHFEMLNISKLYLELPVFTVLLQQTICCVRREHNDTDRYNDS